MGTTIGNRVASAIEVEHGSRGSSDGVVMGRQSGAGEDIAEGLGIFFPVAACEVREFVAGNAEGFRRELVVADGAVTKLPHLGGSVYGDFIGASTVDYEGAGAAELLQHFCDELALCGVGNAHDLSFRSAGAQQRPKGIEDGGNAQAFAHWLHVGNGRVVGRGKEEREVRRLQLADGTVGVEVERDAQCFEDIGGA